MPLAWRPKFRPDNLGEVIDGVVALIDNPDITVDELMEYIPGPDFPTGAQIMGTSGIRAAYNTGRGKLKVRAKAEDSTVERKPRENSYYRDTLRS